MAYSKEWNGSGVEHVALIHSMNSSLMISSVAKK